MSRDVVRALQEVLKVGRQLTKAKRGVSRGRDGVASGGGGGGSQVRERGERRAGLVLTPLFGVICKQQGVICRCERT